jgi:hypothetical protein
MMNNKALIAKAEAFGQRDNTKRNLAKPNRFTYLSD